MVTQRTKNGIPTTVPVQQAKTAHTNIIHVGGEDDPYRIYEQTIVIEEILPAETNSEELTELLLAGA